MDQLLNTVLPNFELNGDILKIEAFGSGLINNTWRVSTNSNDYILQRINNEVFKKPEDIEHNIKLIASYLKKHHPDYLFVSPIKTKDGNELIALSYEPLYKRSSKLKANSYFRMFPFVKESHTIDVVKTPEQAFEAATQFGRFTQKLSGLNISDLKITIPDFHNLSLRYNQFLYAIEKGNNERIRESQELIKNLKAHSNIVEEFEAIKCNKYFKLRVTHHDTKISNVLFDKQSKGLCVIDLDTVMAGYLFSDVGDMIRTYVSPVGEEEKNYSKIEFRMEFYDALVEGYQQEMKDELTSVEKNYFFYAGKFAIYMQSLRFMTDYLNNDAYYGAKYPDHNFVRAMNQFALLEQFTKTLRHV